MTDIDALLEDARSRTVNYGELYGAKETADDRLKLIYAQLYEDAPQGSVAERDSWVRRQSAYIKAVEDKKDAYAEWMAAQTYMKLILTEAEVWRSKQANNRLIVEAHR